MATVRLESSPLCSQKKDVIRPVVRTNICRSKWHTLHLQHAPSSLFFRAPALLGVWQAYAHGSIAYSTFEVLSSPGKLTTTTCSAAILRQGCVRSAHSHSQHRPNCYDYVHSVMGQRQAVCVQRDASSCPYTIRARNLASWPGCIGDHSSVVRHSGHSCDPTSH